MSDQFVDFFTHCQQRCNRAIPALLRETSSNLPENGQQLLSAVDYSLSDGGKRIRPVLVYSTAFAIQPNIDPNSMDYVACSIEMIHAYSLIHDDLPAMDDDDLRRGKPSCHKAFDEATAILAGDALQSMAFDLLIGAPNYTNDQKIAMLGVLVTAAGPKGMVGGQAIDVAVRDTNTTLIQLQEMHALKTGTLIRAALAMGGISSGANHSQLAALDEYGTHIGLAFQVVDDILDVEGDTATLGKTQGKDVEANKPTYVKLLGLEGAKAEAKRLLSEALRALDDFGNSANHLRDLAHYIIERKN